MENNATKTQVLELLKKFYIETYEELRIKCLYWSMLHLFLNNGKYEITNALVLTANKTNSIYIADFTSKDFEYTEEEKAQAKRELAICQWY